MRLATHKEIIARFGCQNLARWCSRSINAVRNWSNKGRIPNSALLLISIQAPREIMVDDEGNAFWLDEPTYRPPEWVPSSWWDAYVTERARSGLGVADDQLEAVVAELDRIHMRGGDISLALRYATTRKLAMPVEVTRV